MFDVCVYCLFVLLMGLRVVLVVCVWFVVVVFGFVVFMLLFCEWRCLLVGGWCLDVCCLVVVGVMCECWFVCCFVFDVCLCCFVRVCLGGC